MTFNKTEFLQPDNSRVPVEKLNGFGPMWVRKPTVDEVDRLNANVSGDHARIVRYAVACCVDDSGAAVFERREIPQLLALPPDRLAPIGAAILAAMGLDGEGETIEEKSGPASG